MDRNTSRIGVLKFGIAYQGNQNRHLPLFVLSLYVAIN